MKFLWKLWYGQMYAWHKVDEYLSRCRGDYELASHDLNLALETLGKYRDV